MPRRFPEDFGPVLYAKDLAEIFQVGVKRIYEMAAEGAFDLIENRPPMAGRMSWSRDRLQQYLNGELRGLTAVKKKAS